MDQIKVFNDLHQGEDLLMLGNAWDVLSAILMEKAGFKAIGTTSWGVANTFGLSDGERLEFTKHLNVIKSIVDHVSIPVSADIEAGYGEEPAGIVENVLRTADAGVAGINLEDSLKSQKGLRDMVEHGKILSMIRKALDSRGYHDFYVNARVDTYFQREDPLSETLERARVYTESGASGIFVPGVADEYDIKEMASNISVPLNVLSFPGLTDGRPLKEWGVKRLSFGNAFSDQVIAMMEKTALEVLQTVNTKRLYEGEHYASEPV
ncbi:isocitrate lyase/PEP mutase family protein [Fictibacillus terranigra]|uniref:Isocitrate lyase/phosphoenolpyruvate mutase family protein n=1 Tax=Fictibacillus terranigra TaxID=3058424 RepID=A0ABT8E2E9_9BACL|nr:isocitrate lyase/phosphoenolpyruvate mutase family protein [Fictibacillus sp. CENA-BCM004]MDN4072082.1 isocitrate lyase/phosphoenolpyruvate mutase family protein [Fictibacillus sp. CENA-BCM004]